MSWCAVLQRATWRSVRRINTPSHVTARLTERVQNDYPELTNSSGAAPLETIDCAAYVGAREGLSHEQGVACVACFGQRRPQNWVEEISTQHCQTPDSTKRAPSLLRRCLHASMDIQRMRMRLVLEYQWSRRALPHRRRRAEGATGIGSGANVDACREA